MIGFCGLGGSGALLGLVGLKVEKIPVGFEAAG